MYHFGYVGDFAEDVGGEEGYCAARALGALFGLLCDRDKARLAVTAVLQGREETFVFFLISFDFFLFPFGFPPFL